MGGEATHSVSGVIIKSICELGRMMRNFMHLAALSQCAHYHNMLMLSTLQRFTFVCVQSRYWALIELIEVQGCSSSVARPCCHNDTQQQNLCWDVYQKDPKEMTETTHFRWGVQPNRGSPEGVKDDKQFIFGSKKNKTQRRGDPVVMEVATGQLTGWMLHLADFE